MNRKVHITEPTQIIYKDQESTISPGSYTIDSEEFCKENDFMQCYRCKDWFSEVHEVTKYHPMYNDRKQNVYCSKCFDHKYK
jgi:hypothetical protein